MSDPEILQYPNAANEEANGCQRAVRFPLGCEILRESFIRQTDQRRHVQDEGHYASIKKANVRENGV